MLHTCDPERKPSSSTVTTAGSRRTLLKRFVAACGIAVGLIMFSALSLQAQSVPLVGDTYVGMNKINHGSEGSVNVGAGVNGSFHGAPFTGLLNSTI